MFTHRQIEAAVAKLQGVSEDALPAFRSRVRNYQRINLIPSAQGKGKRLKYTAEHAIGWALCFELVELGVPPNFISYLFDDIGYGVVSLFCQNNSDIENDDVFLVVSAAFSRWQTESRPEKSMFAIGYRTLKQLYDLRSSDIGFSNRMSLINISSLKQRLGEALGIDWASYDWRPIERQWVFPPHPGDRATH